MADEVLIAQFRADLEGVKAQLDAYIKGLEKVKKKEEDLEKQLNETADSAEEALKKRNALIKTELAELKKLEDARKKAFTPVAIENFNKKISESKARLALLRGDIEKVGTTAKSTFSEVGTTIKSQLAGVGAGFLAAFSVQSVINFGKASVTAFVEAEKNAEKLKFAVTQIRGESEQAFERLIKQSEELQDVTIFSDDSIQQTQAALSAFGLTSDQIEEILPKLADFATVTGQDLPASAEALGQAIKGRAGEFKKFGVEVGEANTEVENLDSIMKTLTTQQGAAAKATDTLSGRIAQMTNEVDDFQETIGGGIVAYFTSFIKNVKPGVEAVIENIKQLFNLFRSGKDDTDKASDALSTLDVVVKAITTPIRLLSGIVELTTDGILLLARTAKGTAQAIQVGFRGIAETVTNIGSGIANVFDGIANFDSSKIKSGISKIQEPIKDLGTKISDAFNEGFKLNVSEEVTKNIKDSTKAESDLLTRLEVKKKLTTELIELQEKFIDSNTITGRSNIKLITDELEARKKAAEENSKLLQKQAEELAKNQELLRKLRLQNIDDEKQQRIAQFEEDTKTLTAKGQLRADIIKEMEIKLVDDLNEIDKKRNIDPLFKVPSLEVTQEIKTRASGESPEDTAARNIKAVEDAAKRIQQLNQEILQSTQQMIGELLSLFSQLTEKRVAEIESVRDKEIAAIDLRAEKIEEDFAKRRISERDFEDDKRKLEAERAAAEKKAAAETQRIKKRQFNIEKVAALSQIAISTAQAAAESLSLVPLPAGAALLALNLAQGALQAGIAAAQPNPYKKGTKRSKSGLALVGEEGPELMMLPDGAKIASAPRTKKYSKVIDTLVDNTFDQHYSFKGEITPRLAKQRKESDAEDKRLKDESLTKLMVVNQITNAKTDFLLDKIAKIVARSPSEIASIIESHRSSPYR